MEGEDGLVGGGVFGVGGLDLDRWVEVEIGVEEEEEEEEVVDGIDDYVGDDVGVWRGRGGVVGRGDGGEGVLVGEEVGEWL